jgi:hypothetical protein
MGRFYEARKFVSGNQCNVFGVPPAHNDNFLVLRHLIKNGSKPLSKARVSGLDCQCTPPEPLYSFPVPGVNPWLLTVVLQFDVEAALRRKLAR